jgi:hypothetical protein
LASEVTLVPANGVALQGGQITVDVRIGHVGYLAGYSFRLWFDPTMLQVVDSDPVAPGTQAADGDIFATKQSVDITSVDNATGRIDYSSFLVGINDSVTIPAPRTAALAKITFQLVGTGASQLEFDLSGQTTNLSDRHADPIACNWVDGQVTAVAATDHLYVPLVAKNRR